MSRRALFAACLLSACSDDIEPVQPLVNRCIQDFECDRELERCDEALGICVRDLAVEPYPLAIQVVPSTGELVDRLTLETRTLTGELDLATLTVPNAVRVSGQVRFEGAPREAQLLFRARRTMPGLSVPVTAMTLPTAAGPLTFDARLEPNTEYDVQVYPLGSDAWELPPRSFPLTTGTGALTQTFDYGERVAFRGRLLDELGTAQRGRKLRLREEGSETIVSSLGRADENGDFTLWTTRSVIEQLARHELAVGVEPSLDREVWLTTVAIKGQRLKLDGGVVVPVVPAPVQFSYRVEVDAREGVENADVTFLSRFPQPREVSQVNGRDWCRIRGVLDGGVACTTEITVALGPDSTAIANLLPGDYDAFIQPRSRNNRRPQAVATTRASAIAIESRPDGGAQSGSTVTLNAAKVYDGTVISPLRRPMPYVSVTAQALGLPGVLGEVARYNRTANALSDARGRFRMTVDLGYYDLIARPPAGSGFAWVPWPNRIEEQPVRGPLSLSPQSPVIARGRLTTSAGRPVTQARVDAYALVLDFVTRGTRPIRVGEATSDDAGVFVLHLPPRIERDPPRDGGVDMDAGATLDAGTAPAP